MSGQSPPGLIIERKVHIVQGEQFVDDDPGTMVTTLLGSCIAACIWDATAKVGGMNHFLLPGETGEPGAAAGGPPGNAMRFGVHAMELLMNALLARGAVKRRMTAKLFGGARMTKGLTDIGELNARFAERFLQTEGIAVVGGSLRGEQGRRIQFWPVSGRARQVLLARETEAIFRAERQRPAAEPALGLVELF